MSGFNRKRALNTLNKQRNRLMKKGAAIEDLQTYFSIPNTQKFGDIKDNKKLKAILDHVQKQPTVTVKNNHIYPVKYIKNHDIWFKPEKNLLTGRIEKPAPYRSNYSAALKSNLMKDKNKKTLLARKANFDNETINRYLKALDMSGLTDLSEALSGLEPDDFWEFIEKGKGIVEYNDVIRYKTNEEGEVQQIDIEQEKIESLQRLYDQFLKPRRK